ncbi:MAG: ATP-binding protein [Chitinispirillia bacterium]|nr:ATP-binding protein [Chitinispirillia bacterium]
MDELIIAAKKENFQIAQDFVAQKLEYVNCPVKLKTKIAIVIEEIFVNIADYAYNPAAAGFVTLRVTVGGDDISVEFEDGGKSYNPLDKENPNIHAGLNERCCGGLGIYMVKNMADTIDYKRLGNKNVLTVFWRLTSPQ